MNVGDAVISGASVAFDWAGPRGLRFRGSAFVADPQLTRDRNLTFSSASDSGLPGVSNVGGALQLDWAHELARGALEASVHAAYSGPTAATYDAAPTGRFGDYIDGGTSVTVKRGLLEAALIVDNVTDRQADTFAFGNPFSRAGHGQLTPLRPRTVTLRIAQRF